MEPTKKKQNLKETELSHLEEELEKEELKYSDLAFPKVTIIIPTLNSAPSISLTLASILKQNLVDLEVVVIDANSTDRTWDIVKSFEDDRIRIYSVTSYHCTEMLNKGISLATGQYINFLFPSDHYTSMNTLRFIMSLALSNDKPHLVYCGTLLRDGRTENKILYRPFSLEILKKGHQPTAMQSCWFRSDVFREIGKLSTKYELRGGFDFLCRFMKYDRFRVASTSRVLTNFDLRGVTYTMVIRHFWEGLQLINHHFGFFRAFLWLFHQKDLKRFIQMWLKKVKIALFGK